MKNSKRAWLIKRSKFFSKDQISEFFELLDESSKCNKIQTKTKICRDPKDNYLVSLAIDSNVDFIITGDKDLLELGKVGKAIVLKYSDFDNLMK